MTQFHVQSDSASPSTALYLSVLPSMPSSLHCPPCHVRQSVTSGFLLCSLLLALMLAAKYININIYNTFLMDRGS